MKIYVVNLAKDIQRWQRMLRISSECGLEITRFEAIEGAELLNGLPLPYCKEILRPMSKSEYGCLLSHKKIIDMVANGPDPYVLVLEDDILFHPGITEFIKNLEFQKPDFDVCHLETTDETKKFISQKNSLIKIGSEIIGRTYTPVTGTGGYIISKKGAKKIRTLSENCMMPIDELLYSQYSPLFNKIRAFQSQTIFICQANLLKHKKEKFLESRIEHLKQRRPLFSYLRLKRTYKKIFWIFFTFFLRNRIDIQIYEDNYSLIG